MAVITIDKKVFEREIGKLDDKMQEKIAMLGTPIEKLEGNELQIEVFPNRPDLLSYHGFKRALLSFLDKKTGLQSYKIKKSEKDYKVTVDSSLKEIRPYTACAIVRGLRLDSEKIREIIEIQEKIHATLGRKRKKLAIGIYPLEKIKLPITFKAIEPDKIKFIPLEAEKEMSGLEILQKHSTGKEYAHLLSGKAKFPVFLDANENVLSMPPIINSQITGKVTEKTKNIFIECSGFDFFVLSKCLNILTTTLADMGGKVYEMEVDYGREKKTTPNLETEKMPISLDNVNQLLGLKLQEKEMKKLLEKMGYGYDKRTVEIPAWRVDVLHEVDLIEDIAIAYGYDNFTPEIPEISTIGKEDPKETIKRKLSEIMAGSNMQEVSNYHLTQKNDQFVKMGIREKSNSIEVENSKTDYNILRGNLTHYLLKVLSENIDTDYPQRIFEIGKVFSSKENIEERESLAIAISPGNFTEIRQILEYIFKMINVEIKLEEPKEVPGYIISGRAVEVHYKNGRIGLVGEIHPKVLKNWKIRMPVALLEIDIERILKDMEN